MARTPLFSALRRTLRQHATLNDFSPNKLSERARVLRRRAFLGGVASATTAGCLLPRRPANVRPEEAVSGRVCIVGGGLAGLTCAYQLKRAGITATVFEASNRVGGRTFSLADKYANNHVAELGAELINSDHHTMLHFAKEFELQLDDFAGPGEQLSHPGYLYYAGGRRRSDEEVAAAFNEQITPQIERVFDSLAGRSGVNDLENTSSRRFDVTHNLQQWLETTGAEKWLIELCSGAFVAEYGRETAEQSVFNLLHEYDGLFSMARGKLRSLSEPQGLFRMLAASDERYRLHLGNEGVAKRLATKLSGQIQVERPLIAVAQNSSGYVLTFDNGTGTPQEVRADRLVLAVPFSTLRHVDLSKLKMTANKRRYIQSCKYGSSAKLMGQFSRPIWRDGGNGGALVVGSSDGKGLLQQAWDTSRLQPNHPDSGAIMTQFVGGKAGVAMGSGTAEEQWQKRLPLLEEIFPGSANAYVPGKAQRMHWPSHRWTKGSYLCIGPGDWHDSDVAAEAEGEVFFCGEHTAGDYQGYMEGAARSGVRAAGELLSAATMPKAAMALAAEFPFL